LVGIVAVGLVGAGGLAGSSNPLANAIGATGQSLAVKIVSVGGLVATASVLLTAILGVSRMIFSMGRRSDLPKAFCKIHERYCTPYLAVLTVGAAMTLLVLFVDLTSVVAVSTFALLFWYVFANIAAFRLKVERRLFPRFLPLLGIASCLILLVIVFLVSQLAWILGVSFLLAGAAFYIARKRWPKTTVANW
jgi:APA family basic amino acid/polyamine antiporter